MAKKQKLLYQTGSNSFFDEMEREVNSTKRKTSKKLNNPVPPEKLFLQFDPSKRDGCGSIKTMNSQPLVTQKPLWKPPIKSHSQTEGTELNKNVVLEHGIVGETKYSSLYNEKTEVRDLSHDIIDQIMNSSENSSEEEKKSEKREYDSMNDENEEVISVNSSLDSHEQASVEIIMQKEENYHPKHEESNNIVHYNEEDIKVNDPGTVLNYLEELPNDNNYCTLEDGKSFSPIKNISDCQNESPEMNKKECEDETTDVIVKLGNKESDILLSTANDLVDKKLCSEENDFEGKLPVENDQSNILIQLSSHQIAGNFLIKAKNVDTEPHQAKEVERKTDESELNLNSMDHLSANKPTVLAEFNVGIEGTIISNNYLNYSQCDEVERSQCFEKSSKLDTTSSHKPCETTVSDEKTDNMSKLEIYSTNTDCNNIQCTSNSDQIDTKLVGSVFEKQKPLKMTNNKEELEEPPIEPNTIGLKNVTYYLIENCNITGGTTNDILDKNSQNSTSRNESRDVKENINKNFEEENIITSTNVHNNVECNTKNVNRNEANLLEEDEHSTPKSGLPMNNADGGKENVNQIESEKALAEENKIQEEKTYMDEEYSCLISNSQLDEIENNYYRSTKHSVLIGVPNKDTYTKFNLIKQNEKIFEDNHIGKKRFESFVARQTGLGSGDLSDCNCIPKQIPKPSVQWPKNMLEMKKKIKDLTGEVERLNSLLMRFRQEIWPQRNSENLCTRDFISK